MNKYSNNNQTGAGNEIFYKGSSFQKGYGFRDQFKRFFKWIIPIFKKHAAPTIESGLKKIGQETISSVSNIARDVVSGKDFQESAQSNINTSISNLKDAAEASLAGRGGKKRSKITILKHQSKKLKDIFS